MVRSVFLAFTIFVAQAATVQAAGPLTDGKWLLTTRANAGIEQVVCILEVVTADGRPKVTVLAVPPRAKLSVKEAKVTGKEIAITFDSGMTFLGTVGKEPKEIVGNIGNETRLSAARLVPTEKENLTQQDLIVRHPVPELLTKAQQLAFRPLLLRLQAQKETDEDKKKELLNQAGEAQKEAEDKLPGMYREIVSKHPDTPAASDAALILIRSATQSKVTAKEAADLVKQVQKQAEPYGPRFTRLTAIQLADILVHQKGLEAKAVDLIEPIAQKLAESEPAEFQVQILTIFRTALEKGGKAEAAKALDARLAKLDAKLDADYLAKVPPFKPTPFAGRKDKEANQVAVLELFTGAQCPPCVAADVAFDAELKAYPPTDLILLQYHMHIPGPDPMTNPDTMARWNYYQEKFPEAIRGTPATVFNGKPEAGGGGPLAAAENKFKQYRDLINPLLEKVSPVQVTTKATRKGDQVSIVVDVKGAEGDDLKLRLLLVEDVVKYVGGNRLRFHHHVVRAMPGGVDGVAVKEKVFQHKATADLGAIRKELTKYLDDFSSKSGPFAGRTRPLELKDLKVIALVQNDETREIVQAVQCEIK